MLSGKVFEYLAAERPILAVVPPDGAAAALIRETGAGRRRASGRPAGDRARRCGSLHERWRGGSLDGTPLTPELPRAARPPRCAVRELADLLLGSA